MIVDALLLLLAMAAMFQPNAGRAIAACIFSGLTLTYTGISGDLDGSQYYIGAAAVDLLILILISGIYPVPRMVVRLQWVCVVSIALNFLGWGGWFLYLSPVAYEWSFAVLYCSALYVLLKKDADDVVGGDTVIRWFASLRGYFRPRARRTVENKGPL